jgi:hypothetical protein
MRRQAVAGVPGWRCAAYAANYLRRAATERRYVDLLEILDP